MASSTRTAGAIVVALGLLAATGPVRAAGAKRVVILNFVGPSAKRAQAAITAHVKRRYTIVPQAVFVKTAKQLRIRSFNNDDVANVARKIHVDAVVAGRTVKKKGGMLELVVIVRDGQAGTEVERVTVPLRPKGADPAAAAKIRGELMPAIERAVAGTGGGAESVGKASTTPEAGGDTENPLDKTDKAGKKGTKVAEAEPPPQPIQKDDPTATALGDDKPASPDKPITTTATPSPPTGGRPPWRPYVAAALGLGGVGRSLSFEGTGTTLQGYSGGLVFALGLTAEVNPLASSKSALNGLGLFLSLDKVLSVSSTLRRANMPDTSLDSAELMWELGLQYGYRLREEQSASTIGLRLGYGQTSFEITVPTALAGMVSVPNVAYTYLDIGPYVRVPFELGGSWWEFGLRLGYYLVSDGGQITAGGRGQTIGKNGSASGLGGGLTLAWAWKPWLTIGVDARVSRFSTDFNKGAAATAASDLFYNVGLTLGTTY